jgi:hypothetical protein
MVNIKKMALLATIVCIIGQSTVQANWLFKVAQYVVTKPVKLAFGSRWRTGISSPIVTWVGHDYGLLDKSEREKAHTLRTQAFNTRTTTLANWLSWTGNKVQNLSEKISAYKK